MVIVKDIEFISHCEHHMVPFIEKAHVAYIPDSRVVGYKLARLVDIFGTTSDPRAATAQIADTIQRF